MGGQILYVSWGVGVRIRVGRVIVAAAVFCGVVGLIVVGVVHVVRRGGPPSVSAQVSGSLPATLWPMATLSPRRGTGSPSATVARGLGQLGARVGGRKVVALTFDDGPGPVTPAVLHALQQAGVQATFFTIGQRVRQHPKMVKRLYRAGMSIQTHTDHHANLARLHRSRIRAELTPAARAVTRVTGDRVRCVRPPYNAWSHRSRKITRKVTARAGLHSVSYNVDTRDCARGQTAAGITRRVLKQVQPGSIILFHDGGRHRTDTVHALPGLVAKLRQHGYRFTLMC